MPSLPLSKEMRELFGLIALGNLKRVQYWFAQNPEGYKNRARNSEGQTPLQYAVSLHKYSPDYWKIVNLLLKKEAETINDLNPKQILFSLINSFYYEIEKQKIEKIQLEIVTGIFAKANFSADDLSEALIKAIQKNKLFLVNFLVSKGAQLPQEFHHLSLIEYAAANNHWAYVQSSLNQQANNNSQQKPITNYFQVLLLAITAGEYQIVKSLLEQNVPCNEVGEDGNVALAAAMRADQPDIFKLLLFYGADPAASRENSTQTTYLFASTFNSGKCKSLLDKFGTQQASTISAETSRLRSEIDSLLLKTKDLTTQDLIPTLKAIQKKYIELLIQDLNTLKQQEKKLEGNAQQIKKQKAFILSVIDEKDKCLLEGAELKLIPYLQSAMNFNEHVHSNLSAFAQHVEHLYALTQQIKFHLATFQNSMFDLSSPLKALQTHIHQLTIDINKKSIQATLEIFREIYQLIKNSSQELNLDPEFLNILGISFNSWVHSPAPVPPFYKVENGKVDSTPLHLDFLKIGGLFGGESPESDMSTSRAPRFEGSC